ncbi:MAG: hypothetical protein OEW27_04985 [Aquincola sp.]|nr:hypothetical protein [Aquincola sp.]
MVFEWFDAKAAEAFGTELAKSFMARVPLNAELSERKFESKARSAIAQLDRTVTAFRTDHRLNMFQKAKVGNAFKWALRDAGYPARTVDQLTDLLMLQFR